jgi:molybdopterin molybdotransferase
MTGREPDWLLIGDALERMIQAVQPGPLEDVELDDAAGRTLARDIASPVDQPPWSNSAMDGFAVRAGDVVGAADSAPKRLRVIESIPAGGFPTRAVGRGEATRIMTGAPLPDGADSVVRVEHTRPGPGDTVEILDDSDAGRNVRARGEDMQRGARVLEAGTLLGAGEIGVLAAVGSARVPVAVRPRVGLLATGNELADLDEWDAVEAGRRIMNSNSYALSASARAVGAQPVPLGIARDDADSLRTHLKPAVELDALVTTAGASVGDHDVVKDVLEEIGMRTSFWRVRIRPGSPFSFGTVPRSGRPDLPVFGLPGNPVSAVVTFEVLVKPVLRKMLHRTKLFPHTIRVRAAHRIESHAGLVRFLRVTLELDDGAWLARLTGEQGSGILTSIARADALLVVPLDRAVVNEGEEMVAIPLQSPDDSQARLALP